MYSVIKMKLTEREETTKYAQEKIRKYLENCDYTSALLLSHIYVDMRLRSLITDWLSPPEGKWKTTSKEILTELKFWQLKKICRQRELLCGDENKELEKLERKRNYIAHESKLWKSISPDERVQIEHLCRFTIQFLERTNRTNSQKS